MGSMSEVNHLARRDGPNCHYCNANCTKGGPKRGTRDHVVPKSFGGINGVSNYVLACAECNEIRGNQLIYCYCDFCEMTIDNWFNDNAWSFANLGRAKIFKDTDSKWTVVFFGKRSKHKSHFAAIKAISGMTASHARAAEGLRNLV